jgi:tetratricopeptide (TPR) repeat protein
MKPERPRFTAIDLLAAASAVLAVSLLCTSTFWLPQLRALPQRTAQLVLVMFGGVISFPIMLFMFQRAVGRLPLSRLILVMLSSLAVTALWTVTESIWVPIAFVAIGLGLFIWRLRSGTFLPMALNPAVQHLRKGEKAQALALVNTYLKDHPNSWQALHMRATISLAMLNPVDAERDAKRVIQLAPNRDAGYTVLGNVYLMQGYYQRARDNFDRALRINPNSANNHYNFGVACYRLNEVHTAYEAFRVVVKKGGLPEENMLLAHYYLAHCYTFELNATKEEEARLYTQVKLYKAAYPRLIAASKDLPDYEGVVELRRELDRLEQWAVIPYQ